MDKLTVGELKKILQGALDDLEYEEDGAVVETECNTYGMRGWILEVPRIGFVDIRNLTVIESED